MNIMTNATPEKIEITVRNAQGKLLASMAYIPASECLIDTQSQKCVKENCTVDYALDSVEQFAFNCMAIEQGNIDYSKFVR